MSPLDQCLTESKNILLKYRKTPLNKIPREDIEKFNLAWLLVQAALGKDKFDLFIKTGVIGDAT